MGAFLLRKQNRNKNVTSVFAIILKRIRKTGEKLSLIYKLRRSVYEIFFESYKCTEIKTILLWKMRIKKERILKQERKTVKKVIKNRTRFRDSSLTWFYYLSLSVPKYGLINYSSKIFISVILSIL